MRMLSDYLLRMTYSRPKSLVGEMATIGNENV